MTEAELQKLVIDMAHLFRWRVAHFRPARVVRNGRETWRTPVSADGEGFPDLVLAKNGVVLFRELKTEKGVVSVAQSDWLKATSGSVWRPRDLDTIEEVLRG